MLRSVHVLRPFLHPLTGRVKSRSGRSWHQILTPAALTSRPQSTETRAEHSSASQQAQSQEQLRKTRLVAVMIGSAVGFFGGLYVLYRKMTKVNSVVEAAGISSVTSVDDAVQAEENEEDGRKRKNKKATHGFRERRIIEYENRIRQYSTPDKVFRYFATLKIVHGGSEVNEVFMTPADFVRSLTPGKIQPQGLGLDEHDRFNPEKHKYRGPSLEDLSEDSVFMKMGEHGLINFSDYNFLLTVLSIPPRLFEIAFQMFDLNGDGEVTADEFEKVQNYLFCMTQTGMRHRDHSNTGSVMSGQTNSGIKQYFFGKNLDKKLTSQKFIEFQRNLQKEVMYLEFMSYEPEEGKIKEWEFADMLMTYSNFHDKKMEKIAKKIKKTFKDNSVGITFQAYVDFFHFLRNISDAEIALSFHIATGKAIDPETFKQVAHTVANVYLEDNIVDVVYKMFDENDDGVLSHKECLAVMKNQLVRGLENPKDTGFSRLMTAIWRCTKHCTHVMLHPKEQHR